MAWGTPLTAVANAALTAAQWNASVRDNLLETSPAKATTAGSYFATTAPNSIAERVAQMAFVATVETTTSTTFTNLTTAGPAVTATTGPSAVYLLCAAISNNTVNNSGYMGVDVSGSSTIAASATAALVVQSSTANARYLASFCSLTTSLTAGSNTFTAKYQVDAGTGSFFYRRLTVIPF